MAGMIRGAKGRQRSALAAWIAAVAGVAVALVAAPASALVGAALKDLVDPVQPGGILAYDVRLIFLGADGTAVCFNPPPECLESPAICNIPAPVCAGDSFTGFFCDQAANQGQDCGVGDPPTANVSLCVKKTSGTCSGGSAAGLPCSGSCPGTAFSCVRSFNESAACGTGNPPHAAPQYCLANPHGICSAGPYIGQPCYAGDQVVTPECPSDPNAVPGVTVTLPIPPGTTFLDADTGGTSDGTKVTWSLPSLGACGVAGTPRCPSVSPRFTVDPLAVPGTLIQAQATATDSSGVQLSPVQRTTVGTFGLRALVLSNPPAANRDRLVYRSVFSLPPGASIDPRNEGMRLQLTSSGGTIADLSVGPSQLLPSGIGFIFKSRDVGINSIVLRQLYPSFYEIIFKASKLEFPAIVDFNPTVTLTFGDDVLTQTVSLIAKRGGARFVASK